LLGDLALGAVGVQLVSLRSASGKPMPFDDHTVCHRGDTLVLSGKAPALALAAKRLLVG